MTNIAQSIKALRAQNRWTQKELSDKTKIKQGIISAYENDKYLPGINHLNALANVFKVSVSVIDERLLNNPPHNRDIQDIIDYFLQEENREEKFNLLAKIARLKKGGEREMLSEEPQANVA